MKQAQQEFLWLIVYVAAIAKVIDSNLISRYYRKKLEWRTPKYVLTCSIPKAYK